MDNQKFKIKWNKLLKVKRVKSFSQGEKQKCFPCKECSQNFTKPGDLHRHIDSTHRSITHACPRCGKQFSRLYNAKSHLLHCKGTPPRNPILKVTPLKEAMRAGLIDITSTPGEPKLSREPPIAGREQPLHTPLQRVTGGVKDDYRSLQFFNRLNASTKNTSRSTDGTKPKSKKQRLSFGTCSQWQPTISEKGKLVPRTFSALPAYITEKAWLPAGKEKTSTTTHTDSDDELEQMVEELNIQIEDANKRARRTHLW